MCNTEFLKTQFTSVKVWGTRKFCSNSCRNSALRKHPLAMKCFACDESFAPNGKGKDRKYCSRRCFFIARKGTVLGAQTVEHKAKMVATRRENDTYGAWNKGVTGSASHSWKDGQSKNNWKLNNKELVNHHTRIRRYRLRGAEGTHSLRQWEDLKKLYNYMCLCCKQQEPFIKLTEDHIVPISIGGSNNISNIQPLCKSCNSQKFTKVVSYIPTYAAIYN